MKFLRCENCGSELIQEGERYVCKYCKRTYLDDSLERAYNRLYENFNATVQGLVSEEFVKQKAEQIANIRQSLYKARTGLYSDSQEVAKWSDELLKLCASDAQANFYSLAAKKRWSELNALMQKLNAREISHLVEGFVEYLTNGRFVERCALYLTDLIARAFDADSEEFARCHKLLTEAAEREQNGVFDVELPRDVFVAYSSKDKQKAYELVEYLELNDFSCFIASRNLAKGADAELKYNERLKRAIDNCQIFLLVSSVNSRSKNCDAYNIEMRYVKERDLARADNAAFAAAHYEEYLEKNRKRCKARVEYLIDEYGPSIYEKEVKKFFSGLTWQTELEGVSKVVFDFIENQEMEGDDIDEAAEVKKMQELIRSFEERQEQLSKDRTEREERLERIKKACEIKHGVLEKYKGDDEIVELPDGIKKIGWKAFIANKSVKKVILPESVTEIGSGAFGMCIALERIILPRSLAKIDDFAFEKCEKLTNVEFGNSLIEIGEYAFSECNSLQSVEIKSNVERIGHSSFQKCASLKKVSLEVKALEENAFYECESLEEVKLGDKITQIPARCFAYCKSLQKINIPSNVTSIGEMAFTHCSALDSIELPEGLRKIDYDAFNSCESLRIFPIPASVESLGCGAPFYGCTELVEVRPHKDNGHFKAVDGVLFSKDGKMLIAYPASKKGIEYVFPKGVEHIAQAAFYGSKYLQKLVIPEGVKSIDYSAFNECKCLMSLSLPDSLEEFSSSDFEKIKSLEYIKVGKNFKDIDKLGVFNENLKTFEVAYDNPYIRSLDGHIFSTDGKTFLRYMGGSKQGSFTLAEGVETIASHAFGQCEGLQNVLLPNSLKVIESNAFKECKGLQEIALPEGVETIGWWAFDGCSSLERIYIPESCRSIGEYAFRDCVSLQDIEICSWNGSFGKDALSGCEKVKYNEYKGVNFLGNPQNPYLVLAQIPNREKKEMTLHQDTRLIVDGVFDYPTSMDKLASITVEGDNAEFVSIDGNLYNEAKTRLIKFAPNNPVTEFFVPSSVDTIGKRAFYSSKNVQTVKLSEYVKTLETEAFKFSSALKRIEISASVEKIEHSALASCGKLSEIVFEPDSKLKIIDSMAFSYNSSLKEIELPDSVENTGYGVFSNTKLRSIKLPKNLVYLGEAFFRDMDDVDTVELPDKVNAIPKYAFEDCHYLKEIVVPESVKEIGENAFLNCNRLRRVVIPATVEHISENAFVGCPLAKFFVKASTEPVGWERGWNQGLQVEWGYRSPEDIERERVEREKRSKYHLKGELLVSFDGDFDVVEIPREATYIGADVFKGKTNIKEVIIPFNVVEIEKGAFANCINLTSVKFEEESRLTKIGADAFSGCKSLASINLENCQTLKSVGGLAFSGCVRLTEIRFGGALETLGEGVLLGCSSLGKIVLESEKVGKIGQRAFANTAIVEIALPASVKQIQSKTFEDCKRLKSLCLEGVTVIEKEAFSGCTALQKVFLPASVEEIQPFAFKNCVNVTVYAETSKKPKGWVQPFLSKEVWNPQKRPVVWNATKQFFERT